MKRKTNSQNKKLICDWTERKNYLIRYKMLNFYVRRKMIFDEVYEVISFKQSKRSEYISFNTQKRNQATNVFEEGFSKFLVNSFFGKLMKTHKLERNFFDQRKMMIKKHRQQPKLTFINLIQFMTAIQFKKMNFLWSGQFMQELLY